MEVSKLLTGHRLYHVPYTLCEVNLLPINADTVQFVIMDTNCRFNYWVRTIINYF